MDLDLAQLHTFSVTVSEGTLDAAARRLHVTPSAISQRLKALETATGRVLLVRRNPVQVTESGQAILRLARQIQTLSADVAAELGTGGEDGPHPRMPLPIAVNADSLATWVLPALAPLAGEVCFEIQREDQDHTSGLLRRGEVMAAITADADPVPGCSSTALGTMRYRPMAAPAFAARWFADGVGAKALAQAPVVVFDCKDDIQHRYLRRRSRATLDPPTHHVPSSSDFLAAVRLGLGWGMLPDLQSTALERAGELVDIDPRGTDDVALYWQQWRLRPTQLERVAETIAEAARSALGQPSTKASKATSSGPTSDM
jgi:LysR family transcriptional regulator, chromosome initiation inhibitor